MCTGCSLRNVVLKTQPESWAMDGCPELWQRWCSLNQEYIDLQVNGWLYQNSQCLRIMGLQNLVRPRAPIRHGKRSKEYLLPYNAGNK